MKRSAFTLVEVLVSTVLAVGLLAATGAAYLQAQRLSVVEAEELAASQNARTLVDRISRDVRQATEFVSALPGEPGGEVATLEFIDGHEPQPGGPYYIRYELTGDKVWRRRHYYYRSGQPETRVPLTPGEVVWEEGAEGGDSTTIYRHEVEAHVVADHAASLGFWGGGRLVRIDVVFQYGEVQHPLHSAVAKRN